MNDRRRLAIRQTLAAGLVLLVTPFVLGHCVGCGVWGARAANAADTLAYERELDGCLVEARDTGRSLAIYEQCAREADKRHGLKDGGAE